MLQTLFAAIYGRNSRACMFRTVHLSLTWPSLLIAVCVVARAVPTIIVLADRSARFEVFPLPCRSLPSYVHFRHFCRFSIRECETKSRSCTTALPSSPSGSTTSSSCRRVALH